MFFLYARKIIRQLPDLIELRGSDLIVEKLLDIDINYYVRVNFSSLINLVNVLGGINVYSEYSFSPLKYTSHEEFTPSNWI